MSWLWNHLTPRAALRRPPGITQTKKQSPMKTLLASILCSITLLLGSCGQAAAGASEAKSITDSVAKITKAFTGLKDTAGAEKAIETAKSALPALSKSVSALQKLNTASAPEALKKLVTGALSKVSGLKGMLSGLVTKYAGMPKIAELLKGKLPDLLKMLPKMGG